MSRKAIRARALQMVNSLPVFIQKTTDNAGTTADDDQLPRADIRFGDEEVQDEETHPLNGQAIYDVDLIIDILNKESSNILDFIDDTVSDIRALFRADPTLRNTAMQCYYLSTDEPELSNEGETATVSCTIRIKVTYAE